MANYRIQLQTGATVMGASETWVTPNYSAPNLVTQLNNLISLRTNLMFPDQYWQGVRIGLYNPPTGSDGVLRRSILIPPGKIIWPPAGTAVNVPSKGAFPNVAVLQNEEDIFRAALQLQCTFDTNRVTTKYLVGVPDAMSTGINGGYNPSGSNTWNQALGNYISFLTNNGWQIQALDRTGANPAYFIRAVVNRVTAPTLLGIIFNTNTPPTWPVGSRMQLQKFRAPKGTRGATINGTWYLDSIDQTGDSRGPVFYLRNSQAVTASMVNFTDKTRVYLYTWALYPVQGISAIRIGIHKRGKPNTAPRGRRLSHFTLDP